MSDDLDMMGPVDDERGSTSRIRARERHERTEKWKERTRVARSIAFRRRRSSPISDRA